MKDTIKFVLFIIIIVTLGYMSGSMVHYINSNYLGLHIAIEYIGSIAVGFAIGYFGYDVYHWFEKNRQSSPPWEN